MIVLLLALRSGLEVRASREAEILAHRQQLLVLNRRHPRVRLWNIDRLILVWLYRLFPSLLYAMVIVKFETVLRWHRRGFRAYGRWTSWGRCGRPRIDSEIRAVIRRMSRENPLWGAPRIHGELLMLGFEISESTVGRYMIKTCAPRSQEWKTFLGNHAAGMASVDLFVVQTISFKLLYGLRHARRRLVRIAVTSNPAAERIAGQVTAFPWNEAPRHLLCDRDGAFGPAYSPLRRYFLFHSASLRGISTSNTRVKLVANSAVCRRTVSTLKPQVPLAHHRDLERTSPGRSWRIGTRRIRRP
jgi:hypothetical protein